MFIIIWSPSRRRWTENTVRFITARTAYTANSRASIFFLFLHGLQVAPFKVKLGPEACCPALIDAGVQVYDDLYSPKNGSIKQKQKPKQDKLNYKVTTTV